VIELIERDDGFLEGMDAVRCFAGPDEWGMLDRQACAEARGRILDVGAGAGARLSIWRRPVATQ
jgi:hypothetical protein